MIISKDDFDRVQKCLLAQRGGNDHSGGRRMPTGAVKCDRCGFQLVVVRSSRGQRYYQCKRAVQGVTRYAACRTVARVPD